VTNQRTDPHCLIPERETRFVFRRSDPTDLIVEELQRGHHLSSVEHLLSEVQHVMNIIRNYDTSVDVDEGIDEGDQGPNTQGASTVAPNVQTAMNNGEQKGVNKRSHDAMIVPGYKVHSSRTESSSTAANVANLPALHGYPGRYYTVLRNTRVIPAIFESKLERVTCGIEQKN
jgi:hypothetical protein